MLQTTSVHMYMEILQLLATYTLLYVEMVEIPTALIQHFSLYIFRCFKLTQNKTTKDQVLQKKELFIIMIFFTNFCELDLEKLST